MNTNKLKRAFSLVEILIGIILIGIITAVIVNAVNTDISSPDKLKSKADVLGAGLSEVYQRVRSDASYTSASPERDLGTYVVSKLGDKVVASDINSACMADEFLKNQLCDKVENFIEAARNQDISMKTSTFGTFKDKLLNDSGNKNVTDTTIDDAEASLQICFKTGRTGNQAYMCSENVYSVNKNFTGYAPDAN